MFMKLSTCRLHALRSYLLISMILTFLFPISNNLTAQTTTPANAKSSFTARLMNIEAAGSETFRYTTTLHNGSADTRVYELSAQIPDGWIVAFKVDGSQVSSINLDANKSQDIYIEINPANGAKPAKYKIPVTATANDTLRLNLEAVVKGIYGVELTTPTGRLSDEITEGKHKEIHLVVKNTASLPLDNLELSAQAPTKWDATFQPAKIEKLEPGKSIDVVATLNVPDKTIAGDYVTTFTAKNPNATSSASFRMTVTTSLLSGWIGILLILLAIGAIYYLIRKYGRR